MMSNETKKFLREKLLEGCVKAKKKESTQVRVPKDADLDDCMCYLNDLRACGLLNPDVLENVDLSFGYDSMSADVLTLRMKYTAISAIGKPISPKRGNKRKQGGL